MLPILVDDRRRAQADARVRHDDREVGTERSSHLTDAELTFGHGHSGADEQDCRQRVGDGGEDRGCPDARSDLGRGTGDRVEDEHRDAVTEQKHPEVERKPDHGELPVEREHDDPPDRARQDRLWSTGEHEREHERDLAQRHRVRAAAEVNVDRESLGGGERDQQRPERHGERGDDRRHVPRAGSRTGRRRPRSFAPLRAQIAACPEDIRCGRDRRTDASSERNLDPRSSVGDAAGHAHAYPQLVAQPTLLQLALVGLTLFPPADEQSTQLQLAALQLAASGSAAVLQLAGAPAGRVVVDRARVGIDQVVGRAGPGLR